MTTFRRLALACLLLPDLLLAGVALAGEPASVEAAVAVGPEPALDRILAVLEAEPSVADAQRWAVGQARADPAAAVRLVSDARLRGALPLVRVRGRFEQGEGTRWDHLDLQDVRDEDRDVTVDLWLEWDLGDLASGPDVLRAVRESRELVELRQAVVNEVTIAYFDRRRLRAEELLAPADEPVVRALDRRLRLQELDATLHGLTGGRWTEALSEASEEPPEPESEREPSGEDPDPGLRVPVHPADRPPDP